LEPLRFPEGTSTSVGACFYITFLVSKISQDVNEFRREIFETKNLKENKRIAIGNPQPAQVVKPSTGS